MPVAQFGVDAVVGAEVVITMFPRPHVIAAYRDELLGAADPGTLFIESSTIAVDEARTAHALAVEAGHRNIDAPVSGGVVGAGERHARVHGGRIRRGLRRRCRCWRHGQARSHCGGPGSVRPPRSATT
jgi:3-hydroxyisobutyrate dehydrogenase